MTVSCRWCVACAIALIAPLAVPAAAQTWPAKPMRIVVPFPPTGVADTVARIASQKLQERLGQPVIVDNRPGGSGSIGAEHVAKSPADGTTFFMGHIGTHGVNPALFAKLPYDPVRDFAPVSLLVSVSNLLVAHPSLPASDVPALIALARQKPGAIAYASPGAGTSGHMSGELLSTMTGVALVHVPYKGSGPAMQDVLGGQVPLLFDTLFSQMGNVRAGKLKALGITSAARSPLMPEVPTIAEQGLAGYEIGPWFGLLAPAATPRDIVQRMSVELAKLMADEDVRQRLGDQGVTIVASTPEAFGAHIRAEIAKWGPIVRASGARAD